MRSTVTESDLINWINNESLADDLFCHFEDKDQWDWTEISGEWRRLNNLMFGDDVQAGSPIGELASAAICQAYNGAIAAVAAALGVNETALLMAVAPWTEAKESGEVPAPVGFSGLEKTCAEFKRELSAMIQRQTN